MTLVKSVLFDLGNVLVHYNPQELLTAVAALTHASVRDLQQIANSYTNSLGTGQITAETLYQIHISEVGLTADYSTFVNAFCQGIRRNEEALSYALALQARPEVRVGVLSNTNALHVDWLRLNVPELWVLDAIIMSNEVGLMKPDPVIYRLALGQLGSTADSTLFIDDIPENVHAAQAMGMVGLIHEKWPFTRPQIEAWLKQ